MVGNSLLLFCSLLKNNSLAKFVSFVERLRSWISDNENSFLLLYSLLKKYPFKNSIGCSRISIFICCSANRAEIGLSSLLLAVWQGRIKAQFITSEDKERGMSTQKMGSHPFFYA